jgi:hypothetical protein
VLTENETAQITKLCNLARSIKQKALTRTGVKQGLGVKACNYPYNMNQQDALFSINLFKK